MVDSVQADTEDSIGDAGSQEADGVDPVDDQAKTMDLADPGSGHNWDAAAGMG